MLLSRLERSLLSAQRGPFLSPDDGNGGGGSAGTEASSNQNANGEQNASDNNANASGAQGNQSESGGEAAFRPITSEAELTAWKTATRKDIVAQVKKDLKSESDAAAAKAQGDFKALYEAEQAKATDLADKLAKKEHADLQRAVAVKHKLPADLASRLIGETEAELDEDAKKLAKTVGTREAPDTEAGAGAKGATGTSDRPIPPKAKEGEKTPAYTFDGRPKVAWTSRP